MYKSDTKLTNNLSKSYISDKSIKINIDSRNRTQKSKNILFNKSILNNCFTFTNNSNLLKIHHINHNMTNNDLITINNVIGKKITIKIDINNFILNTNKLKLLIYDDDDNNITELSNKYITNQYLDIFNIDNNNVNFIYNINVNFLKNIYKIYHDDDDNYFYIKLFTNIYKSKKDNLDNLCYIGVHFLNINGININRINSDYPISNTNKEAYKKIYKIIDNNYYIIKLNDKALNITNNNLNINNNISIAKIKKTIIKENSNNYQINLSDSLSNIKSIRLINTIIPNTEYNIYNNINNKTFNKLYFTILHENQYILEFNNGIYNPSSFIIEVKKLVKNINFNPELHNNSIYLNTYINININISTNIVKFSFFRELNLINSLKILTSDNDADNDNVLLLITQNNHYLNIEDTIIIEDSESIENINKLFINRKHKIYKIVDKNCYLIKLDCKNSSLIIDTNITTDNLFIKLTYPLKVSFNFTYSDTIGELLGFKDIGFNTSITNYYNDIYNTTPYKFNEKFDNDKLIYVKNNKPIFKKINYILLYCNIYNNINSSSYNKILLGKLLLDNYGSYCYNKFINITNEYTTVISNVNKIRFTFEKYNGELYDFGEYENSFVLEFIVNKIENLHTNINTQTGLSNVASTIRRVTINKYN